jgi:anti-sigma regulatory factor (Ser/Thr protein kinase)
MDGGSPRSADSPARARAPVGRLAGCAAIALALGASVSRRAIDRLWRVRSGDSERHLSSAREAAGEALAAATWQALALRDVPDSPPGGPSGAGAAHAPQDGSAAFSASYPARAESVGKARAAVAAFASRSGAAPATVEAVRLAVSEAATNVVVHAYRDLETPGEIDVAAAQAAGELWVIIADNGSGLHPRPDSPGLGLGLGLIAQVSDGLDLVHRAAGGLELRMRFVLAPGPA